ncbi:DUF2312 domain-containing protein [Rhizobium bangladeshense]|uniref:DUF2312 domain-containing protein n=1 Tax=Rhizobium bangladeshense TaxID=1138189 RepID=UPI001C8286BF|nr:GapR family DNA-binding domain-containing protein [Rhizobium bangladeshense]MBX4889806.1 DUF2312 domain-containing protein [Rhizobium bangladeshense]
MSDDGQIKSFFQRWQNLEDEKQQISDLLKDLFSEAKGFGYDTKALRAAFRRKVKEDLDNPADAEFEAVVDLYINAINAPSISTRDTRVRVREKIEEFDPITGEFIEESPRKAAEAVSERTAFQGATVASDLVGADKAEAVAEVSGQPETISALTVQLDGVNVGGHERAGVTGGESAATHSKTDAAISRPGIASLGRPEIENRSDQEEPEAGASGEMQDESAIHLPTNSEIAPPSEGEAGAHAPKNASLPVDGSSGEGANAGGDHVTAHSSAAKQKAGALVKPAPAKPLRPYCRNPGERCGGYGSTHCASCLKAAREAEVAA